jgi:hypothetical protein
MNRVQLLLVGTAILGLVGCGEPNASAPESPVVQAANTTKKTVSGFSALQGVTEKTAVAVKASKFDQAKVEFENFEPSWKTVEDGVKAKSLDTYKKVEESLDTLNGEFKNKQPDRIKALKALESLSQSITVAAQPEK